MKTTARHSIDTDPAYAEALRVQNELGAKYRTIQAEITAEEKLLVADVDPSRSEADIIGDAMTLQPGVRDDSKRKVSTRIAILRRQLQQIQDAQVAHANTLYGVRRDAGYRAFAKDDGGYIEAAERLLAAVDTVIAINQDLDQRYKALYDRGCEDVQHVLFPRPALAENVLRDREGIAHAIELLKQTVARHSG
jgi:hypothetical protein